METDSQLRYRGKSNVAEKRESLLPQEEKASRENRNKIYGTHHIIIVCSVIAVLVSFVYYWEEYMPESKPLDSSPVEFSGDRARKHLESIAGIGPRTAGSYDNDVLAVNYLLKELNFIKDQANPQFHIEVDLQRASGSFAFFRKATKFMESTGITSTYDNTSNVIVKISPNKATKHFVLVNAHFDTVMNTEGASDDTVNCAILIETFRAISLLNTSQLKHGVIFLFNGAEEGGLSGSHAFLQHRWFPLVRVLINVEAAGSGGKAYVFQTGPGHPWILAMYASTVKYPSATVLAQEIFESGIIPSDTDFRVFVNYGNLVGVDIAFAKNGYVYHTRYDNAKAIPSGCIQRAGENVYALTKGIANSEYLQNPEKYKHGSSVFFDVLGLFIIHYPKRLHLLMNWITCGAVVLYIVQKLGRRRFSSTREHMSSMDLVNPVVSVTSLTLAVISILFSWILAFSVPVGIAYILTKLKFMMTWYSYPKFALLLYGFPALFGLLLGHFIGNRLIQKISFVTVQSFVCGHLVIYSSILFYANHHEVSSSFILWFWIIFPFLFLGMILDCVTLLPEKRAETIFLFHIAAIIPPGLLSMYTLDQLYLFFGPLMGRIGDKVPSDIVIAVLSAFGVVVVFTYLMNMYHGAFDMKRVLYAVGIVSLIPFGYVLSGEMVPYSGSDPVTPKRIYMNHMLRRFHNPNGSLERQDSGLWIQPVDALAFQPLESIEFFKDAEDFKCDGSYCGLPYYYAKRVMMKKQWYLRGEKPEGIINDSLSTNIYERVQLSNGAIRFNFNIIGPSHMSLFLTLKPGVELDWSMYKTKDNHIFKLRDYHGGYAYVVFYTHGYEHTSWKFWLELKKSSSSPGLAQLGIAQHHLYGKKARTKFLNAAINACPDWIHDNSWCSNYDSFMLE